jgi:hypothetical protein
MITNRNSKPRNAGNRRAYREFDRAVATADPHVRAELLAALDRHDRVAASARSAR